MRKLYVSLFLLCCAIIQLVSGIRNTDTTTQATFTTCSERDDIFSVLGDAPMPSELRGIRHIEPLQNFRLVHSNKKAYTMTLQDFNEDNDYLIPLEGLPTKESHLNNIALKRNFLRGDSSLSASEMIEELHVATDGLTDESIAKTFAARNKAIVPSSPYGEFIQVSFEAFGEEHRYELRLDETLVGVNSVVTVLEHDGMKSFRPPRITYRGRFQDEEGYEVVVTATVLPDASISGTIFMKDDVFTLQSIQVLLGTTFDEVAESVSMAYASQSSSKYSTLSEDAPIRVLADMIKTPSSMVVHRLSDHIDKNALKSQGQIDEDGTQGDSADAHNHSEECQAIDDPFSDSRNYGPYFAHPDGTMEEDPEAVRRRNELFSRYSTRSAEKYDSRVYHNIFREEMEENVEQAQTPASRSLFAIWPNCIETGSGFIKRKLTMALFGTYSLYQSFGNNQAHTTAMMMSIMADASVMYHDQLYIFPEVTEILILKTSSKTSHAWNDELQSTAPLNRCKLVAGTTDPGLLRDTLYGVKAWIETNRSTTNVNNFQVLTGCRDDSGTVGLAYVDRICVRGASSGANALHSNSWQTVAHELGHNFAAQHQMGLPNIMSYSGKILGPTDPYYAGKTGFTHALTSVEICPATRKAIAGTQPGFPRIDAGTCLVPVTHACGNGIVEPGEECDSNSPCCNQSTCKLTAGSTCDNVSSTNSSTCCVACKEQPPSVRCRSELDPMKGPNSGICLPGGVCGSSLCGFYGNTRECSVDSSKCRPTCYFDPSGGPPATTCGNVSPSNKITQSYEGTTETTILHVPSAFPQDTLCGTDAHCNITSPDAGTCVPDTFRWATVSTGTCSTSCGSGTRSVTQRCERVLGSGTVRHEIDSVCSSASGITPRITSEPCTGTDCSTTWTTTTWSTCSTACQQTRTVQCKSNGSVVPDGNCSGSGTKPSASQSCNGGSCTYSFQTGQWGACGAACGASTRSRTVTCQRADGSAVALSLCSGTAPATSESCESTSTCTYTWQYTAYGACSNSCGSGTETRTATCKRSDGTTVAASFCGTQQSLSRPCTGTSGCSEGCVNAPCTYSWSSTAFSACVGCGASTQTRTVTCKSNENSTVADSLCASAGTKPAASQQCTATSTCTFAWNTGSYSACSSQCGAGTQTRTVTCRRSDGVTVQDSSCSGQGQKPPTQTDCTGTTGCSYSFVTGAWSTCSSQCGSGTRTRTVSCRNEGNGQTMPTLAECTAAAGSTPSTSEACTDTSKCQYAWSSGAWTSCQVSGSTPPRCGSGTRTRTVECRNTTQQQTTADSLCSGAGTKPAASDECTDLTGCSYVWQTTAWSACSATCGQGQSQRSVTCVNSSMNNAPAVKSSCSGSGAEPPATQTCTGTTCNSAWVLSDWSTCAPSCGSSTKTRSVVCKDVKSGQNLNDSLCSGAKPAAQTSCVSSIGCQHNWKITAEFPDCETGSGAQSRCTTETVSRSVICSSSSAPNVAVAESLCDPAVRPAVEKTCPPHSTCTFKWVLSNWSHCSTDCGSGSQSRSWNCIFSSPQSPSPSPLLPHSQCSQVTKSDPAAILSETCTSTTACRYSWISSRWSECSKTCGSGTVSRNVDCVRSDGVVASASSCQTSSKPSVSMTCTNNESCAFKWKYNSWSSCSTECGSGTQTRTADCVEASTGLVVDNSKCTETAVLSQVCDNTQRCSYSWDTQAWSECSFTATGAVTNCGVGLKTRIVACKRSDGLSVTESLCPSPVPQTEEHCESFSACTYSNVAQAWSACQGTCPSTEGTQYRAHICVRSDVSNTVVSESFCADSSMGPSTQACVKTCSHSATHSWIVGDWNNCSVDCGTGVQTRDVYCVPLNVELASIKYKVADSNCTNTVIAKPLTSKPCTSRSCVGWVASPWSPCSQVCQKSDSPSTDSVSLQTRSISCQIAGVEVDASRCVESGIPPLPTSRTCPSVVRCPEYQALPWSSCSSSVCHKPGVRTREMSCVAPLISQDAASGTLTTSMLAPSIALGDLAKRFCSAMDLPPLEESCEVLCSGSAEYRYEASSWSQCSAPCGYSTRSRTVKCVRSSNGEKVEDESCASLPKLSLTETCAVPTDCPTFKVISDWSSCEGTCGHLDRLREVACASSQTGPLTAQALSSLPSSDDGYKMYLTGGLYLFPDSVCEKLNSVRPSTKSPCVRQSNECSPLGNDTGRCGESTSHSAFNEHVNHVAQNSAFGHSLRAQIPQSSSKCVCRPGYFGTYCEQKGTITVKAINPPVTLRAGSRLTVEWTHWNGVVGDPQVSIYAIPVSSNDANVPSRIPSTISSMSFVPTLLSTASLTAKSAPVILPTDFSSSPAALYVIRVRLNDLISGDSNPFRLPDPCDLITCGANGTCNSASGTCICKPGYFGRSCGTPLCQSLGCSSDNSICFNSSQDAKASIEGGAWEVIDVLDSRHNVFADAKRAYANDNPSDTTGELSSGSFNAIAARMHKSDSILASSSSPSVNLPDRLEAVDVTRLVPYIDFAKLTGQCFCKPSFIGDQCLTPETCSSSGSGRSSICENGGFSVRDDGEAAGLCSSCVCSNPHWYAPSSSSSAPTNGSDLPRKCSTCALNCGNGSPNESCTACNCKSGYHGARCECQHVNIGFSLSTSAFDRMGLLSSDSSPSRRRESESAKLSLVESVLEEMALIMGITKSKLQVQSLNAHNGALDVRARVVGTCAYHPHSLGVLGSLTQERVKAVSSNRYESLLQTIREDASARLLPSQEIELARKHVLSRGITHTSPSANVDQEYEAEPDSDSEAEFAFVSASVSVSASEQNGDVTPATAALYPHIAALRKYFSDMQNMVGSKGDWEHASNRSQEDSVRPIGLFSGEVRFQAGISINDPNCNEASVRASGVHSCPENLDGNESRGWLWTLGHPAVTIIVIILGILILLGGIFALIYFCVLRKKDEKNQISTLTEDNNAFTVNPALSYAQSTPKGHGVEMASTHPHTNTGSGAVLHMAPAAPAAPVVPHAHAHAHAAPMAPPAPAAPMAPHAHSYAHTSPMAPPAPAAPMVPHAHSYAPTPAPALPPKSNIPVYAPASPVPMMSGPPAAPVAPMAPPAPPAPGAPPAPRFNNY